jgi:eight-cysteine-cluster-containing protein
MPHVSIRPLLLACSLLALACDKPSSDPDAPTGGGVASAGGEGGGVTAGEGKQPPEPVERKLVVPKDHQFYARFEGSAFANDCKEDTACKTGGCSSEACTAEEGVITDCEMINAQLPPDASCGCVESECVWWSPSGATLAGGGGGAVPDGTKPDGTKPDGASTEKPTPNSGEGPSGSTVACGTKTCKPGQECIEYYGIAGPKGPKFESCEWRCAKDGSCPKGTKCVTVADGPGRVCR